MLRRAALLAARALPAAMGGLEVRSCWPGVCRCSGLLPSHQDLCRQTTHILPGAGLPGAEQAGGLRGRQQQGLWLGAGQQQRGPPHGGEAQCSPPLLLFLPSTAAAASSSITAATSSDKVAVCHRCAAGSSAGS